MGGHTQATAGDTAQKNGEQEDGLLELPVGQRTADGGDDGNQNCGNRACVTPVAQVHILVDAGRTGQRIEVDGDQGGHQQGEGGIADVVEDPVALQCREFEFFFHGKILSFFNLG